VATLRYFAGWADKLEGRTIPTAGFRGQRTLSYTVREPIGVVAQILPWNAPTTIFANKLAPALAAGCSVVVKPSEDAPLAPLHIARLTQEAGFPPGVVNVVAGLGETTGASLSRHPGLDKISFTGSREAARDVQRAAAEHFTRVSLELGGKSPHVVLADADLEAVIPAIAMGLFVNQGEVCAAGTRVIVHRSLHDQVVDGLSQAAATVRLGDPLDPDTTMGPLINAAQLNRVLGYIDAGRAEGAEVVAGGGRPDRPGYFVEPTIFAGASSGMRIAQEEIFGPVGTVIAFDDAEEAVAIANSTPYDLTASVWTRDVDLAHRVAGAVRSGVVWINNWGAIDPRLPWGGVRGSGIGRELSRTALDAHTEEKVVTIVMA
jgi:betaine-aldehyde dehydrogenase